MEEEKKVYSPSEYFDVLKDKKNQATDEKLANIYENCMELLNKYKITGQIKAMKKLMFHIETIEKEREIVALGIDTYVYRDDIEEYIEDVADEVVKIIDLENYERDIPDEVVLALEKVKDKFDKFYVVFTDYTGKVERQVQKERRDKDPILFGTFQDRKSQTVIDRFYFIGDWEDEFCDLTLDKMVNEFKASKNSTITRSVSTPDDLAQLKKQLDSIVPDDRLGFRATDVQPKGLITKVRTFLKGVFS